VWASKPTRKTHTDGTDDWWDTDSIVQNSSSKHQKGL